MTPPNEGLFSSDLWNQALERYASAAHVTVKLFDADERLVLGPIHPTPLFQLFKEKEYDPGMFIECARRCLAQTESRPTVIVAESYGLAVVGTSLVLEGKVVGAAVGGYAFVDFSQVSEIQRLASNAGIKFERLWQVAREQKPVPKQRLILTGELLQVLGDAMLRENYRIHQYEEAVVELEEAARETDMLHRDFREQAERLNKVEKMAAAGQLAAAMAHEVNNPLAAVTNALYLLETKTDLDPTARGFVTMAASELARISRIVKQSLSYYKVGTIPRDVNLGEIVNESLQIFSSKIHRAGIDVKLNIAKGTLLVGFPDELRQVIDNLLHNALEAMPGGGRLTVSLHESFDWASNRHHRKGVRLTIADTGCGIAAANRRRIFEPFFSTKPEKGTGLGLWILQGIILKHEGVMSLRSSDAKGKSGTVISIFLPSHARAPHKSKGSKDESVA